MSDSIKHECGIALIRLRKPLEYYKEKYGTWMYGINKLYLLMEKQHNRGQDGAGLIGVKIGVPPGQEYFHSVKSVDASPIKSVFETVFKSFNDNIDKFEDAEWVKTNLPYLSDIYLGHLRYGTFGKNSVEFAHPVIRENNWKSRNLAIAGNFNLTNVDELFNLLVEKGQHPKAYTDTVTVLEKVGHYLDRENQSLFDTFKQDKLGNEDISELIHNNLDMGKVLKRSSKDWDGGYAMAGVVGHGDAFVTRDPWGIRPAHYYIDDEIVVVASERPVIQTVMNVSVDDVKELTPGEAIIVNKNGDVKFTQVREPEVKKSCSFERIYFSRGSDKDIYNERKMLGKLLAPTIMKMVDYNFQDTVFSFIPNTAETSFYGMMEGIRDELYNWKLRKIEKFGTDISKNSLSDIIKIEPRMEKIAIKDVKMRTFIADDNSRDDLVSHVYDVSYGIVKDNVDTLVVIDDSIVRGTTLKQSIIKILDRLNPKKIIVVSSAPQIRYPDCYGIDMAVLNRFAAFEAAISLLKERGLENIIDKVYEDCKNELKKPKEERVNKVKAIYDSFSYEEVSARISQLLTPSDVNCEVEVLYQTIDNLHISCPNDLGDWYFSGNYPTPGGVSVVNKAFINYYEGSDKRAY